MKELKFNIYIFWIFIVSACNNVNKTSKEIVESGIEKNDAIFSNIEYNDSRINNLEFYQKLDSLKLKLGEPDSIKIEVWEEIGTFSRVFYNGVCFSKMEEEMTGYTLESIDFTISGNKMILNNFKVDGNTKLDKFKSIFPIPYSNKETEGSKSRIRVGGMENGNIFDAYYIFTFENNKLVMLEIFEDLS